MIRTRFKSFLDRYWPLLLIVSGPVILVGGQMLLVLGGVAADAAQERLHRLTFDPVQWQDRSLVESHDPIRIRMVDDLLDRYDFGGMTRDEAIGVLGEPDRTPYFREWDMVYWLGPERGFMSIDSEWLVLRLDRDGRVCDYRIARD